MAKVWPRKPQGDVSQNPEQDSMPTFIFDGQLSTKNVASLDNSCLRRRDLSGCCSGVLLTCSTGT